MAFDLFCFWRWFGLLVFGVLFVLGVGLCVFDVALVCSFGVGFGVCLFLVLVCFQHRVSLRSVSGSVCSFAVGRSVSFQRRVGRESLRVVDRESLGVLGGSPWDCWPGVPGSVGRCPRKFAVAASSQ